MSDELQERIIFLQSQIDKANTKFDVWKEDLKEAFEKEIKKVEAKNANICRLYGMELQLHKAIINQKQKRIDQVTQATKQAVKMMEHPRLMQLIVRQIKFEQEKTS